MDAIIITIGDEILLGQILDTNSQYIAKQLTRLGAEVVDVLSVPDQGDKIREWIDYAMMHAELVIVTGGLGPTKDDVTKKVLAEYFDTRLVLNEEVYSWIEKLLRNGGMRMNENNKGQAFLPENCKILLNHKGTASGMWFERERKVLVSLPGVPFEMEDLMTRSVIPELRKRYPHLMLEYRMLKVYDIPESELAIRLESWEEKLPKGLGLAYLPSPGFIKLRLTAKGEGVYNLDLFFETLKEVLQGLRFTVGEEDCMERELGELLLIKGKTIATAESCTGGNVAQQVTSIAGASAYFKGSVVAYANEIKERVLGVDPRAIETYGAVSEQVVVQMAEGVRRLMGTDYAVSTSGVAGPTGGTPEKPVGTVWIGLATPEKTIARKYAFSFTRERNIGKATMKAIELVIEELRNR
ncbi:competence/damage-inducible protein A [uncultured Sanguibacteroides sp.]|uniref:competence/damage-inducible protein A n=1 Tax=uncultured Sanguibacteroides sp. TaxID=1635151 RepID=UPI0025D18585|nr:competence/damage-inducible protein A [uncultured Sanguibacteroides sp.]